MDLTAESPQPPIRLALTWKLLTFIVLLAIAHALGILLAALLKKATSLPMDLWQPAVWALLVLVVSALFLRLFERRPLRAIGIGIDRSWLLHSLLGTFIGFALCALVWIVFVVGGWASWRINPDLSRQVPRLLLGVGFSLAIAVYEELLCRGYAFQILARWNRVVGATVTGIYFVAIHFPQPGGTSPLAALNMFLLSLLFVVCLLRTRRLWLGIAIHFAWNFALGFVFGMPLSGRKTSGVIIRTEMPMSVWTGNEFGPEAGLVATVVLAAAAILLWRLLPQSHPWPNLLDARGPEGTPPKTSAPRWTSDGPIVPALAPQTQRIMALDVLRGFAVLGILPGNIQLFAMHDAAVLNPYACEWTDSTNVAVWAVTMALFARKDLMLFAMLFGAGILMVADRCDRAGRGALQTHVQRMATLMLIGILHAYLIWSGDILFTYAVCGLAVFFCRRWPPARLLLAGIALFLVPMALLVLAQSLLPHLPTAWREAILGAYAPTPQAIQTHYEIYRGSWLAQTPGRISAALSQHTFLLLSAMGWVAAGMMLVGMGLYRLGYLTGERSRGSYIRLLGWSVAAGVSLTALGFYINFRNDWRAEFSFFIGRIPVELGAPLIALACVAGVMLMFANRPKSNFAAAFAAVGQMTLTNYLVQSLICAFFFYGSGLGWVGRVDRVHQWLIVIAIWLLQLFYSPIWLHYFHFGPVEWLWRSSAYLRWQPFRKRFAAVLS